MRRSPPPHQQRLARGPQPLPGAGERHPRWQALTFGLRPRRVLACSEGGFFKALMTFPKDYPNSPPTLKIVSDFWHPNVYPDGRVCIS